MLYRLSYESITVVGKGLLKEIGIISALTNILLDNDINLFKLNPHHNSITIFIDKKDSAKAYPLYHDYVLKHDGLSSISQSHDLAMISLTGPELDELEISRTMSENNIEAELINVTKTEILLFVDWDDGEKACKLIEKIN